MGGGGIIKMLIFFANVHVIKRRQLIFHGICQFQFLDPHTHTLKFFGGIKTFLEPPQIFLKVMEQCLETLTLITYDY